MNGSIDLFLNKVRKNDELSDFTETACDESLLLAL